MGSMQNNFDDAHTQTQCYYQKAELWTYHLSKIHQQQQVGQKYHTPVLHNQSSCQQSTENY